ncbi:MAG TPA: aminoglycoside phosphotransferase family protein [Gemmatimonadaceae bacterium]|nr:aminoglycoside phosphotransferase family protein [Gemmatimonadaceae bacterium]
MASPPSRRIPERLRSSWSRDPALLAWLNRLPAAVDELARQWELIVDAPFDHEDVNCSWVARARRSDGTRAVLKVGMPHMEGEHEIQALRFWNGDPTVRLLEADEELGAMLLERCEPGTSLRALPEPEQDIVLASLLRRLWRTPSHPHPFRHLSAMLREWRAETLAQSAQWPDAGLVTEGLRVLEELARPAEHDVLLATDLRGGNVLRAAREPWLVIDPKPFIGDPAYDATQHLKLSEERMLSSPHETIRRFAGLLEVDAERVRMWVFGRAAAEPRAEWDARWRELARVLATG